MDRNTADINTDSYWDSRFLNDWESLDGPNQSRFFSKLTIESVPDWFLKQLRRESLTLADWGCAQGDGTEVWTRYLDSTNITGIDFSVEAISQARRRYPGIRFQVANWLDSHIDKGECFDIIFSSNTLEHFHKPFEVLEEISKRARKAIVLALPFNETQRIEEHFFTFTKHNIPLHLNGNFSLIWAKVVDCRILPSTSWVGDQIILVYGELAWLRKLHLTLDDCLISDNPSAQIDFLIEQLNLKDRQLVHQQDEINKLTESAQRKDEQISCQEQQLKSCSAELDGYKSLTSILKISLKETEARFERCDQILTGQGAKVDSITPEKSVKKKKVTKLISRFLGAAASQTKRYDLLKDIYWKLPGSFRQRLNPLRNKYIAKHFNEISARKDVKADHSLSSDLEVEWLKEANSSQRIVIIPCGFEFDELVNQRPINAAKYFAENGWLVLFVAWQWSPNQVLSKGCSKVWESVYQVPLFDLISKYERLRSPPDFSAFIITMPAPSLIELIPSLRLLGFAIVYDVMDEWEEFFAVGQAPWYQKSIESALVIQADYVCAVSPSLQRKFLSIRSDIGLIGNGYDPSFIGKDYRGIAGTQKTPSVIVGYFGHLTDAWFDWRQLLNLAETRRDVKIEIIGYGEPEWVKREIENYPNIHLLGKVAPSELHNYVVRWSVGLIPFIKGVLAEAVDPIKIYEYLFFGLPVVVTGITHLKSYPNTYLADDDNFAEMINVALESKKDTSGLDLFLERTTWQTRFERLKQEMITHQNFRDLYAD